MVKTDVSVRSNLVPAWISRYRRAWLPADIAGGLTVAALLVPEGMAYAQLAGMPPETAFYAAPIGLVIYALLGSSRQLVVAVSSAVAVLSGTIVGRMADEGSEEFIALSAALAIAAGVISVLSGLLRLGKIAQFFSESVLTGFIFGLALVIMIKQVPKILGIEGEEGNFFERLWSIITHLGDTNGLSLAIGVGTIALMVVLERYVERLPAALIALIAGIVVGELVDVADEDVEVVGALPSGLAAPKLPDVDAADVGMLIVGGLAITVVAFAEAIGPARQFASEHKYDIDDNRELVGIGAANVGAGLFQGFAIGSSLSKSAASDRAGTKTPLALVVAAIVTACVALFLTDLLTNLPEATLGGIVVVAISGMIKVPEMRRMWQVSRRPDFAVALTALLGVLLFDALPGLLIAVVLSLGLVVWNSATARLSRVGRRPHSSQFVLLRDVPDAHVPAGMLLLRLEANLYFANAHGARSRVRELVDQSESPITAVVLNLAATSDVDLPGCDEVRELAEELDARGASLSLTHVRENVRAMFDRTGVTEAIGEHRIFANEATAVAAHVRASDSAPGPDDVLAEAAAALRDLAGMARDEDLRASLERAIESLERDRNA